MIETVSQTPSGIEVYYSPEPRRHYKLRRSTSDEWVEVPSVTTVLDCLKKGGLDFWGMRNGIAGCIALAERGLLWGEWGKTPLVHLDGEWREATVQRVEELMREHSLRVNDQLGKAADRGSNVHDALEQWARHGVVPDPDNYPETERGYVRGLVGFLADLREVEDLYQVESCEVAVGSLEHGYAGRFDLLVYLGGVTLNTTPSLKRELFEPGLYLLDLKTSSGVYASHHLQLVAYRQAAIECGYPAADDTAVLHVTSDGLYEVKKTPDTFRFEDFLHCKGVWEALERQRPKKGKESK